MPEDDDDVRTGSGRQRWDRDRKLAMETALNYAKGLDTNHLLYIEIDRKVHGDMKRFFDFQEKLQIKDIF